MTKTGKSNSRKSEKGEKVGTKYKDREKENGIWLVLVCLFSFISRRSEV